MPDPLVTFDPNTGKWIPNMALFGNNVRDYGPITPDDNNDLAKPAIGLLITGTSGTIVVTKPNGSDVTIPASIVSIGAILPLPAKRIKATGTTATVIWAVYGS